MLKKLLFITAVISSLLGVDIARTIPFVEAALLIDCEPAFPPGGDTLGTEPFYIRSFPGTTLSRIDLWLQPNVPGTYTLSLVARINAFDGPEIGSANTIVTLSDTQNYTVASFNFPSSSVVPGSLLTFEASKLSGPDAVITFEVYTAGGCPVVETEDATPPLSTFRRDGIAIKVYGDPPQAISWQGDVSFSIKTTSTNNKDPENTKFVKSTLPFTGTIQVFTAAKELVPDQKGCYVNFSGGDGTKICIKEVATVESDSKKSKKGQLFLRGTGEITTTIEWVHYSGVVYVDITGTLKQNDSGELNSISLKGKIGGGADLGFVFDATFSADLNK